MVTGRSSQASRRSSRSTFTAGQIEEGIVPPHWRRSSHHLKNIQGVASPPRPSQLQWRYMFVRLDRWTDAYPALRSQWHDPCWAVWNFFAEGWNASPLRLRILIVAVILATAAAGLSRGVSDLHDQAVKRLPTDFSNVRSNGSLSLLETPIRELHGPYVGDRYAFIRQLGAGKEGSAALYTDFHNDDETVVVKSFDRDIARNPIPSELKDSFARYTPSWPTEIEASLLLNSYDHRDPAYLPVLDYFILQSYGHWTWNLVTPFVPYGTLLNLAAFERDHNRTLDTLDKTYRPVLIKLLHGLEPLHNAGLCHDDIKHDNIFIASPHNWLLGDLGNVRHISHRWHHTRSWVRQNQWSDCQLNDIRRTFKTYLWFLRSSVANPDVFDHQFWKVHASWSRLHWDFEKAPVQLGEAIARARGPLSYDEDVWEPFHTKLDLAKATERELICTSIPKRLWEGWWDYIPDI